MGQVIYEDEDAKPITPTQDQQPTRTGINARTPSRPAFVLLQPLVGFGGTNAPVKEDGTFVLSAVQPDRYRLKLQSPTGYVRAVRFGTTESDQPIIDLRNGSAGQPLTLMVTSGFAEVSGVVTDSKGPVARVRVLLLQQPWSQNGSSTTVSAGDGTYKFPRVAPGKYLLIATDDDDILVFQGVIDNYEDVMETIEPRARDKITRDLKRRSP